MCRVLSNHPKLLFFFHHFTHWTHTYRVNSSLSPILRYLPLRYLLDPSISLHLMVTISIQVTSSGHCWHLLTDHPTSKCPVSPPSHSLSVHNAAEKSSCNSVWFLMMCFLVMIGWRTEFSVLQSLLQDLVFTLSVLCSHCAPLAVSAWLAQPPQKTLSIPSPTPEVSSVWNTLPHSFIRLSSVAASSGKPLNLLC